MKITIWIIILLSILEQKLIESKIPRPTKEEVRFEKEKLENHLKEMDKLLNNIN